jgi:hypothetical protein
MVNYNKCIYIQLNEDYRSRWDIDISKKDIDRFHYQLDLEYQPSYMLYVIEAGMTVRIIHSDWFISMKEAKCTMCKIYNQENSSLPFINSGYKDGYFPPIPSDILNMEYIDIDIDDGALTYILILVIVSGDIEFIIHNKSIRLFNNILWTYLITVSEGS